MIIWQTLKVTGLMLALFTLSNVTAIAPNANAGTALKISVGSNTIKFSPHQPEETPSEARAVSATDTLADVVAIAFGNTPKASPQQNSQPEASKATVEP